MHKTAVLLIALVGPFSLLSLINAEPPPPHGPPSHGPPGYYSRGPPPPGGPPGHSGPPPYKIKPAGPSKIFSWLGSKMPKMPHFQMPRFPSFPKYKPNYPPNYQAVILPQPSYGMKHGGGNGPEKVQISGPMYNAIPNTVYYTPGQDYQVPTGNTVNTVIYETHQHASPGGSDANNGYGVPMQIASQTQPGVVYESGNSDISYQHVPAQKVYSPAPSQFFKQSSGNMEILPSKMVSYQKETIATGVPEYHQLQGSSPAGSYSNPKPNYSQAPPYVPSSQGPDYHNTGYRNQQNQVQSQQRVDQMNYGSMFQDTQPQVSPIYDLSSINLDNLGGGTGPIYQAAASEQQPQQQQQVYNLAAPETVSLDSILSSFGQQQQQQGQIQYQSQGQSSSDTQQGAYSQQSIVQVAAPPNFSQGSQGGESPQQSQDLNVAESQYPGVQIRAHAGGQDGVFEVIADANAPTYEGGHPFDIKAMMSMIEPGAQFGTSDIVAEGAAPSENQETYAVAPQQEQQQNQGQYQVQDNSGSSYTILQQGTNSNFNNLNNSNNNKINTIKGHVTFPDEKNLTHNNALKPFKESTTLASTTLLNSDFIPNTFQTPGGNSNALRKDKYRPRPKLHDLIKASHDRIKSTDNELLTFGRPQKYTPVAPQSNLPLPASSSPLETRPQKSNSTISQSNKKSPVIHLGTENPLANTRRFSEDSPLIIYHTVKPFISSYINGNLSSLREHPNHNYNLYKASPSSITSKAFLPGLVPTVNSFFDSVSSEVLDSVSRSRGGKAEDDLNSFDPSDLFVETEGDLAASDSRQVKAYAITVTPPTNLFNKMDNLTTTTSSMPTVSTDMMIESSKNISSSVEDKKAKRFPIYQRKSKPSSINLM